jgi:hypothetical protein
MSADDVAVRERLDEAVDDMAHWLRMMMSPTDPDAALYHLATDSPHSFEADVLQLGHRAANCLHDEWSYRSEDGLTAHLQILIQRARKETQRSATIAEPGESIAEQATSAQPADDEPAGNGEFAVDVGMGSMTCGYCGRATLRTEYADEVAQIVRDHDDVAGGEGNGHRRHHVGVDRLRRLTDGPGLVGEDSTRVHDPEPGLSRLGGTAGVRIAADPLGGAGPILNAARALRHASGEVDGHTGEDAAAHLPAPGPAGWAPPVAHPVTPAETGGAA